MKGNGMKHVTKLVLMFIVMALIVITLTYSDSLTAWSINGEFEPTPPVLDNSTYKVDDVDLNITPQTFSRSGDSNISDLKKLVADDISRLAKDEILVALHGPKGLSVKVYSSRDDVKPVDIEIVY